MEPDSTEPTLFGVKLTKVEMPLIENSINPIDFVDRSWVSVVERIFQDRCDRIKKKNKNKEAKVNWLKEGF
jgi:hypothetical protein